MTDRTKIGGKLVCWQFGCVISDQGEYKLEPLPLAFLKFLVAHQGQVVTKEQLLKTVWHNRQVSDDAIRRVVKLARTALGDDAKSPRYIKTLPLQGYMLVAEVEDIPNKATSAENKALKQSGLANVDSTNIELAKDEFARKWPMISAALALMLIISLVVLFTSIKSNTISSDVDAPVIEKLTTLNGAERHGSFCLASNTLLFIHRSDINASKALYTKNLTTKLIKRISFTNGDFQSPLFSPDCSKVAYVVKDQTGNTSYLADFTEQGLANVITLTSVVDNKKLVSWSADSQSLYFSGPGTNATSNAGNKNSAVITRYLYQTDTWQQVTFSLVEGKGDFFAKESADGRYLSILRNSEGRRSSVLILDLVANTIAVERHLPFYPNQVVWLNDDPERIAISSHIGDFFYYHILQDELQEQVGSEISLNDVFYHCANKCFYMRQYGMNYSDIKEVPNPFYPDANIAALHMESDAADFNPVYSPDGNTIYFTKKQKTIIKLLRKLPSGDDELLFSYDPRQAIYNLQIGPNEKYATGKLDNRIFILNLTTKSIEFITAQQEQAFFPLFSLDGLDIFFSRLEQDKVVLQQYDITKNKVGKLEEGFYARFETYNGNAYLLNHDYRLFQELADGSRKFIVQLGKKPYYNWQVSQNHVYFTKTNGANVDIYRLNINTGILDSKELYKGLHSYHFNLHPSSKKILIAESLLPQSDLVKVIWQ